MRENGLEKEQILKILDTKLREDFSYQDGSILGSMCTEPLDIAKEVYTKYISKNLGDPGLFPGTMLLEEEVVSQIGELFNTQDLTGCFTTGGSEANIIAMRIAKKLRSDIKHPEVVLSRAAHISFDKAADILGIRLRKVDLNENFELNLDKFAKSINKNTCGVVGVAGTTSLGLVDPIEKMGDIIEGKDIFFHVDAAFGGFVLPFLEKSEIKIPNWDFSVENVNSITADPHKMGMGVIPSGGFFLRDKSIIKKIGFEIPYLAGGNFKHLQFVGTRSGSNVIAFWAIMNYLGKSGFKKIISDCMENTKYLGKRIRDIDGIRLAVEPVINVLGITTNSGKSICQIDDKLRRNKWMLGKFLDFNLIRAVIMPHVKKEHLDLFCEDLEKIVKQNDIH
jgi:tyrosine decarboxylase / aspartate 1-decarboxylase